MDKRLLFHKDTTKLDKVLGLGLTALWGTESAVDATVLAVGNLTQRVLGHEEPSHRIKTCFASVTPVIAIIDTIFPYLTFEDKETINDYKTDVRNLANIQKAIDKANEFLKDDNRVQKIAKAEKIKETVIREMLNREISIHTRTINEQQSILDGKKEDIDEIQDNYLIITSEGRQFLWYKQVLREQISLQVTKFEQGIPSTTVQTAMSYIAPTRSEGIVLPPHDPVTKCLLSVDVYRSIMGSDPSESIKQKIKDVESRVQAQTLRIQQGGAGPIRKLASYIRGKRGLRY